MTGRPESPTQWAERARRLENLGFSTLLLPDTMGGTVSPVPALAAAAAVTERLRIGTYVLANDYRHPLQVARDAAALDLLSGGRFELGLGAGRPGSEADYTALGLQRESPGVRFERRAESLQILDRLLRGERADFDGRHYHMAGAAAYPAAVQKPRPPLLVAASGPRMLALAGRAADIVAVGASAAEAEDAVREKVAAVRTAAGERAPNVELNLSLTAVGRVIHPEMARWMGGIDVEDLARQGRPTVLSGSVDQMCDQLRQRRESLGVSYWSVNDALVEPMLPVVERLAGR
ncbi:MAG: TIGR03621 family F420-dependent LLM class oxidoreductase [Candidatus Dormibacteraeota bacterium]|nr:TIGR03621 family F420-dependent LLM class oxidoreductase [Candidatus Dormibacteraeota bacterium]